MSSSFIELTSVTTTYHRMTVDGVGVFYREAGPKEAPAIVLLHGFPIALDCGFSCSGQFSVVFRRIADASPGDYRRSL
jgi:pimeloyl-ACP methyl ester carboxylesterase